MYASIYPATSSPKLKCVITSRRDCYGAVELEESHVNAIEDVYYNE